ncbi:MAG: kinase [bacterium]
MIISRTPFRVSFFGGGTDYPVWYENNGGAVLSTSIDKYCYLTCRYLPQFFEHKHRIVYSKIEMVREINEIQHPAVRAILNYQKITDGVEIHHDGDLPARTGLGSSSAFTVGLLNSLYALKGIMPTKDRLAKEAIHIERDALKEHVGSQDQIAVSYGGFNRISFDKGGTFHVEPITLGKERLNELQDHLMLYFTGFSRIASHVAQKQIENTPKKQKELTMMHQMVDEAIAVLAGGNGITDFGKLMHESWQLKRSLTDKISTSEIDNIYQQAQDAGAVGGKLLGAGGGGFMLFFVKPELQPQVREKLKGLLEVKFRFESSGSQIIFYQDESFE